MTTLREDHRASVPFSVSPLLAGRVQADDPEEDNAVFDLLYDYETVPLSRGAYSRDVTFAGTLSAALYREQVGTSSHNLGTIRGDKVAVCIPLVDISSCWWGQSLTSERLPITQSGRSIHFTYHGGHEHLVLAVDRAMCQPFPHPPSRQGGSRALRQKNGFHQQFLTCSSRRIARWSARLQKVLRSGTTPSTHMTPRQLENEVVTAVRSLFESCDAGDVPTSTAKSLVESALEHIDAAETSMSVADVCAALHVGRRTLELAFRHVVDTSPRQYLLQRQLSRSYALLKRGNPESMRVTDVALACGFYEFGRFAGRYRKAFGETPRQTLLKRPASNTPKVLSQLHMKPS